MVKEILESGYSLIIDEQNLNPDVRKSNIEFVKNIIPDIKIKIKYFPISLEEAIKRDKLRDFSIGEKVIKRTWHKYKDQLIDMLEEKNKFEIEYDPDLKDCIIVDVDGTLAIRGNRSPFDFTKVKEDKVSEPIKNLVNLLSITSFGFRKEIYVIIFSGRDDSCFDDTKIWLVNNNIDFDKLVMRKTGDNRKDSIVKKEMYEKHIKENYNVLYVIDDRKQVVDMWRNEIGLIVLDVAGNQF